MKNKTKRKLSMMAMASLIAMQSMVVAPVDVAHAEVNIKNETFSTGLLHSLVVKSDGTVWAWGFNIKGQLGDGTTINSQRTPVQTKNLTDIVSVSANNSHSLALKSDGTVWAWGDGSRNQIGLGAFKSSNIPVQVSSLTNVVSVKAGAFHSLALKSDGTVWGWGNASNLGINSLEARYLPVEIDGLTDIVAIETGQYHSLALKADGTVYAWGGNAYGDLGDGSTTFQYEPVQIATDIIKISSSYRHSLALKADGTVYAWGNNTYGQIGDGSKYNNKLTPIQVEELTDIVDISAGTSHSIALKSDGTVYAWGKNENGELGDNSTSQRLTPVQSTEFKGDVVSIDAGNYVSTAIKSDGSIFMVGMGWSIPSESSIYKQTNAMQIFSTGEVKMPTISGGSSTTNPLEEQAKTDVQEMVTAMESLNQLSQEALAQNTIDEVSALIEKAETSINALPDGEVKDQLIQQLAEVKETVLTAQAKLDVQESVEVSNALSLTTEEALTQTAIDEANTSIQEAQTSISALPESEVKDQLAQQLQEAKEVVLTAQAKLDVVNAETTLNTEAIAKAEATVSQLTDSEMKIELQERISAMNTLVEVNNSLDTVLASEPTSFEELDENIVATEITADMINSLENQELNTRLDSHVEAVQQKQEQAEQVNIDKLLPLLEEKPSNDTKRITMKSLDLLVKYAIEQTGAVTKQDFGKVQSFVQKLGNHFIKGNEVKEMAMSYLK